MTARYRCPWCGRGFRYQAETKTHLGHDHADKLFALLRKVGYASIESFGTPDREIVP